MRALASTVLSFLVAASALAAEPPAGWLQQAGEQVAAAEYEITAYDGEYQAPNRAHNFRARFSETGLRIVPRTDDVAPFEWGLDWVAYGGTAVPAASLSPNGKTIDLRRGSLLETYENGPQGLKQGFVLPYPPSPAHRAAAVHLDLALRGELAPVVSPDGQAIDFLDLRGARRLRYAGLVVTDARGREVPARMEVRSEEGVALVRLVLDASDALYPITIDPLATSPAWIGEGQQTTSEFGRSVATAGDVNGDGYSDVLVGAPFYDGGSTDEGRVFLYLGGPGGLPGGPSFVAESDQAGARLGWSVATAGDIDGDGFSDFAAGAPYYDGPSTDEGRVLVFRGGAGLPTLWTALEADQAGARFGTCVAPGGDVNGNGFSDLLVGATHYDNQGRAFLYYGSAGGLATPAGWQTWINQAGAQFGNSLSTAGDVDGDGFSDVIVGAPFYDGGQTDEGRVLMYRGGFAGLGGFTWTFESDQAGAQLGWSVAAAGDVDGDGYSDVLLGAPFWDDGATIDVGRVYMARGSATSPNLFPTWIKTGSFGGSNLGWSVATAGDVNGDGLADVAVAMPFYFLNPTLGGGRVEVYTGIKGSGLAGTTGWIAVVNQANAAYGWSVATAGDVNGDGYSDLIVGAPWEDNGENNEGRAYVYMGGPETTLVDAWNVPGMRSSAGAGDVNGDGFADVIVGAPGAVVGGISKGKAFVYHGNAGGISPFPAWSADGVHEHGQFGFTVAGAGDVNGDGFDDVVIGAPRSSFGTVSSFYVYLGSASGLAATPVAFVENSAIDRFASSVASARDVNADGFDDVIVGAPRTPVGMFFIYLGSATGLVTPPAVALSLTTTENDLLGQSVGSAGDVNGDGYADVIVGAPGTLTGRALVWLGGPGVLQAGPAWSVLGPGGSQLGFAVASAGDVNGDGLSDVIVGAPGLTVTDESEGGAFIYLATPAGISTTPSWSGRGNHPHSQYGAAVGSAGDTNGDGLADVIVGDPFMTTMQGPVGRAFLLLGTSNGAMQETWSHETLPTGTGYGDTVGSAGDVNGDGMADVLVGGGSTFAYFGGKGAGMTFRPRQRATDDSRNIAWRGVSDALDAFRIELLARTPFGRGKARLEWQVRPLGTAIGGTIGRSATVVDTGVAGAPIGQTIGSLQPATPYHWRARLRYERTSSVPYFPHSRWVTISRGGWNEAHLRTPGGNPIQIGPMAMGKSGAQLSLAWEESCNASDTDYAVYEGQLGSFTSHVPRTCSTGGALSTTITPGAGNRYYLVVPHNGTVERSYGQTSSGVERAPSAGACRPQSLGLCP